MGASRSGRSSCGYRSASSFWTSNRLLCMAAAIVMAAGAGTQSPAPLLCIYNSGNSPGSTPVSGVDETDSLLFFEDFESGATDWTTIDLTAQVTWHKDDFNHYGPTGLSWWAGDSIRSQLAASRAIGLNVGVAA